jgi:hypothetical protein
MRNLFALLALIGFAGIVFGVMTALRGGPGPAGPLAFGFESYGGPGSVIGGLMLVVASLYLRSAWRGRD